MELLAQEINIPVRKTAVAVPIINGGRFDSDPQVLMVHQDYPDNHPDLLRPVQGGQEPRDTSMKATVKREMGEEADVWLDDLGNFPVTPVPLPHNEGVPREHCRRGLQIPVYFPHLVLLDIDWLPDTSPQTSERIASAGWFPLREAYERSQLINRDETRVIIGRALLNAFALAGHPLNP